MEFGYNEDKIDETVEQKMRRQEGLRDVLCGAKQYVTISFNDSTSRKARNKARYERIMKKREELMKLVNKK